MIDNRRGLAVDATLTEANGRAEREAALAMAKRLGGGRRKTLGADKATMHGTSSRACVSWA